MISPYECCFKLWSGYALDNHFYGGQLKRTKPSKSYDQNDQRNLLKISPATKDLSCYDLMSTMYEYMNSQSSFVYMR